MIKNLAPLLQPPPLLLLVLLAPPQLPLQAVTLVLRAFLVALSLAAHYCQVRALSQLAVRLLSLPLLQLLLALLALLLQQLLLQLLAPQLLLG